MKSREALKVLAEVSESQWGMVTSAQALARGVSHMNLTRLAESGDFVRLAHGIYKDAGAPSTENDELRAAWLAAEPAKQAWERLSENPGKVVVSGESASRLHGIGEFRASRSEFTTPVRRQSQRTDVHYRTRVLTDDDVTIRDGLPVTTKERTIADLVEDRQDLSLIGHALRDAARQSHLDTDRLTDLLAPLAERNGHPKGNGAALLDDLMEIAGIDAQSIANQLVKIPELGVLVAEKYLASLLNIDYLDTPGMRSALKLFADMQANLITPALSEALSKALLPAFSERLTAQLALPSAVMESIQSATTAALPKDLLASLVPPTQTIASLAAIQATLSSTSLGNAQERLAQQPSTIDGATITQSTRPIQRETDVADT